MAHIAFDYTMSLTDYQAFNRLHYFKPLRVGIFGFFFVLNLVFFIYALIFVNELNYTLHLFPPVILVMIALLPLFSDLRAKKVYETASFFREKQHVVVNDEKIEAMSESGNFVATWDKVYQAVEFKPMFAIYTSKLQAFIIPKSCLTPENMAALRQLLTAHIEPKKLKLKREAP